MNLSRATRSSCAFLTCSVLGFLAAGSAKASTITFLDATEQPSISVTGNTTGRTITNQGCVVEVERAGFSFGNPAEVCTVIIDTTNGNQAEFDNYNALTGSDAVTGISFIADASNPTQVSDLGPIIEINSPSSDPNVIKTQVTIEFVSDLADPLIPCNFFLNDTCNLIEGGTVQSLGSLTWSNGTVDTLQFQSAAETPEPGTLVLFGSGLISLMGFARRKLFIRV